MIVGLLERLLKELRSRLEPNIVLVLGKVDYRGATEV
jgi:hypothetical protein